MNPGRLPVIRSLFALSAAYVATALVPKAQAFDFLFDYSYDAAGFFGGIGSAQRNALESAASYFEGIIGDDFDAIVPNVGNGDTWTAGFFNPGSDTRPGVLIDNLVIPANTLLVYVGASDLGGALGLAQPGNASVSGSTAWNDTVIKRGESGIIDPTTVGNDTEVAPRGGVISFDSSVTWNFDDIGYDVFPEPTSALLLFTAGISLLLRRPRRDAAV